MYKNRVAPALKKHRLRLKMKEQLFQYFGALKNKPAVLQNPVLIHVLDLVVKVLVFFASKAAKNKTRNS